MKRPSIRRIKTVCNGGPYNKQYIKLFAPSSGTAYFSVGKWKGRYVNKGFHLYWEQDNE